MKNNALEKLNRLLVVEEDFTLKLNKTRAAKNLQGSRNDLLTHVREVGRSGDLSLIVTTEQAIVEGDLSRYATQSPPMTKSLEAAINEIASIERHIHIVDDHAKYQAVDQEHSLPKNREKGLPLDEARRAFRSHYVRLNNLNRARLSEEEKKIIDARKSNIFQAGKLYAERQAKTLGVDLERNRGIVR
jgi:hypothetical protein